MKIAKYICLFLVLVTSAVFPYLYNKQYTLTTEIQSVVIGPIAGEYGYETEIVYDESGVALNTNEIEPNTPNILTTFEYLKKSYPNIKKVGLVVGWYVDSLCAETIKITPKVDSRRKAEWQVGDFNRTTAPLMNIGRDNRPNWVGTPTDKSVVQFVKLLHDNGLEVTIYPFIFVDNEEKQWRGLIEAKSQFAIDHFFEEYEKFLLHYANLEHDGVLLKDIIHGFLLGSELEKLLKFKNREGEFPAVSRMSNLADKIRGVLGDRIQISYAANWSEYHHTEGGWFYLDDLWANSNINFVGIDAYFPLTSHLDKDVRSYYAFEIEEGWTKGEHYDYFVNSSGKKVDLAEEFAIGNIAHWWQSEHINPDGKKTKWLQKMKPIVFTEIGFIPIHKTTDEPFKFINKGIENLGLPDNSDGTINTKFQYEAIKGTLDFLKTLKNNLSTYELIKDVYWYNIDPRPDNDDWIYNHEIKVKEFEDGDVDLKKVEEKKIYDLLNSPLRSEEPFQ